MEFQMNIHSLTHSLTRRTMHITRIIYIYIYIISLFSSFLFSASCCLYVVLCSRYNATYMRVFVCSSASQTACFLSGFTWQQWHKLVWLGQLHAMIRQSVVVWKGQLGRKKHTPFVDLVPFVVNQRQRTTTTTGPPQKTLSPSFCVQSAKFIILTIHQTKSSVLHQSCLVLSPGCLLRIFSCFFFSL